MSGWRLLHRELAARRRPLLAVLAWSALQAAPAIGTGVFLAWSIDRGFLAGNLVVGFGWLVAIGVLAVAARLAQRQTFGHLADVVEPLRDNLTRLVVSSTIRTAVDDGRSTDLAGAARITGQVETVRNVVSALLRSVNGMGLSMLAAAVGLATLAPAILLVVAPCLGAAFVLFGFVVRMLYTRRQALVLAEESVAASADHVLAGARDVDALQAHQQALGEIEQAIDEAARSARVLASVGLLNSVVILIGGHLPVFVVLLAAPSLIGTGHLEAGVVLGAVTYLRGQLMGGLGSVMGLVSGWGLQLGATLRRISETSRRPDTARHEGSRPPVGYRLRVENLTFAYGPTATPVLDGFDLTVEEGEHVAILGASGIGKSTLANLLSGLLAGQRGQIELGGVPLPQIAPPRLRRLVALIPQEAYVFDGTLRENLTYLSPAAADSDLDRTVDALGMRPLVGRLGGYEAQLAVGNVGLSQGESQLVALARVHLSPASVVILDEATCHLDPQAEALAERAFVERPGTLIVIAHRLSSAMRARRVVLFDGTRVCHGTHDDLRRTSALYRELMDGWAASGHQSEVATAR